jgi:voltage-gated potassium channel
MRLWWRQVSLLLGPGRYARWSEIVNLLSIYANLLVAFSLIHYVVGDLSLDAAARDAYAGTPKGIGDYLYFSVVVMTTLGFGDITPATGWARVVVSLQCISSYFMLAILVGVITKGIVRDEADPAESG